MAKIFRSEEIGPQVVKSAVLEIPSRILKYYFSNISKAKEPRLVTIFKLILIVWLSNRGVHTLYLQEIDWCLMRADNRKVNKKIINGIS